MLFLSGFNREQGIPEYPVTPACYQDQNSSCQGDIVRFLSIIIAAIFCTFPVSAATPASDDSYIAGYAAAILKFQFGIDLPSLTVRNGNITLPADKLPAEDRTRITQLFSEIPGVTRVEIVEYTAQQPSLASPGQMRRLSIKALWQHAQRCWQLAPAGRSFIQAITG